jgi:predicted N-acetyltransferase YhbS
MAFKQSFQEEPALSGVLFDLLDRVFPGVREVAQRARELGAAWESASTPFVYFDGGRAVSHVGLLELSLILLGQPVTVGSVHGVATHPHYRRRGCFRRLMEEVLQHAEGRYETLVLTTEHPEYFEPFGFRVLGEHFFAVDCQSAGGSAKNSGVWRSIDRRDANDRELLNRLLETREPVSQVVGVVNEKAIFCFNEGWRPLRYSPDLDVIVCSEWEDGRLKLFDLVGPMLPSLTALVESLTPPVERVEICFAADRLAPTAPALPYLFDHDGPSYLMARGPFPAEGEPFSLPRSART